MYKITTLKNVFANIKWQISTMQTLKFSLHQPNI